MYFWVYFLDVAVCPEPAACVQRAEGWLRARRVLEREVESLQGRIEAGERREVEAQDAAREDRRTLVEEHEAQLRSLHQQLDDLRQHNNQLDQVNP